MIPFPCVRVPKSSRLEFQRSDSLPCSFRKDEKREELRPLPTRWMDRGQKQKKKKHFFFFLTRLRRNQLCVSSRPLLPSQSARATWTRNESRKKKNEPRRPFKLPVVNETSNQRCDVLSSNFFRTFPAVSFLSLLSVVVIFEKRHYLPPPTPHKKHK